MTTTIVVVRFLDGHLDTRTPNGHKRAREPMPRMPRFNNSLPHQVSVTCGITPSFNEPLRSPACHPKHLARHLPVQT